MRVTVASAGGQKAGRVASGTTAVLAHGRMSPKFSLDFRCDECEALVREWLDARRVDLQEMRKHLLEAAQSSGREPEEMRAVWLASIARMPHDEMQTVMRAHYPRTTAARRKQIDHGAATGHPVAQLASAVLLGYRRQPKL
jgi:hypothetical protein